MNAEVINLTALARMMGRPTPLARKKLDELGVKPTQEVQMPSGRKFVLFDKVKAIKAIEKGGAVPKRTAKPAESAIKDTAALQSEVQELRAMMQQLLEVVTAPAQQPAARPTASESPVESAKPTEAPKPQARAVKAVKPAPRAAWDYKPQGNSKAKQGK